MTSGCQKVVTVTEALREFLLHLKASRAPKIVRFNEKQLMQRVRWADANSVPFAGFGKRHLDRYLVARAETGKAHLTFHHDAICAKSFFAWCAKNDILERSLLRCRKRQSALLRRGKDFCTLLSQQGNAVVIIA